jgi:hypothetical protein
LGFIILTLRKKLMMSFAYNNKNFSRSNTWLI